MYSESLCNTINCLQNNSILICLLSSYSPTLERLRYVTKVFEGYIVSGMHYPFVAPLLP